MDKILSIVFKLYKKIRPPKRLYRWGTIALKYFDDRTIKEKFFDYIDDKFFNWQQKVRATRAYRKVVFNSFFCYSLGKVVHSTQELKDKEKEGYRMMSFSELERTAKHYKDRLNKEQDAKSTKYWTEALGKIKSGNSNYVQQMQERIKSGDIVIRQ
jgi:hypothetical protein